MAVGSGGSGDGGGCSNLELRCGKGGKQGGTQAAGVVSVCGVVWWECAGEVWVAVVMMGRVWETALEVNNTTQRCGGRALQRLLRAVQAA